MELKDTLLLVKEKEFNFIGKIFEDGKEEGRKKKVSRSWILILIKEEFYRRLHKQEINSHPFVDDVREKFHLKYRNIFPFLFSTLTINTHAAVDRE